MKPAKSAWIWTPAILVPSARFVTVPSIAPRAEFTGAVSVTVLLAGFRSRLVLETVALLVTLGAAALATPTVRAITAERPGARSYGVVQVTTWPLAEQVNRPWPSPLR